MKINILKSPCKKPLFRYGSCINVLYLRTHVLAGGVLYGWDPSAPPSDGYMLLYSPKIGVGQEGGVHQVTLQVWEKVITYWWQDEWYMYVICMCVWKCIWVKFPRINIKPCLGNFSEFLTYYTYFSDDIFSKHYIPLINSAIWVRKCVTTFIRV